MSAELILNQLHTQGLTISLEGDRLAVRPKDRLTDELRQAIRDHKPDLIRLLALNRMASKGTKSEGRHNRPEDCGGPPYPDSRGRVKCFYCTKVEIAGHRAVCQETRTALTGIALLRECGRFAMKTIH